jgi:hypothetical protein
MRKAYVFLPLLILIACTPKSPNLTQREAMLINSQDILQWAEDSRRDVLTAVRELRDSGAISAATVERFRALGKEMERVQRTAVEAQRSYILSTTPLNENRFLAALEEVKRLIIELQRLWQPLKEANQ